MTTSETTEDMDLDTFQSKMNSIDNSTTLCNSSENEIELYHKVVYMFSTIVIVLAGSCINSYVLFAIRTHMTLQTYANGLVVNLCVADLLTESFLFGRTVSRIYESTLLLAICDRALCASSCVTIMMVTAISVDRFASLKYSLNYSSRMTGIKVLIVVVICWVYSLAISLLPVLFNLVPSLLSNICDKKFLVSFDVAILTEKISVSLLYFPCLVITMVSYFKIYRIARYHSRTIEAVDRSVFYNYPNHRVQRSIKYVQTIGFVLVPLFVFTLPVNISRIIYLVDEKIHYYLLIVSIINTILNPFTYAYNRSEFQSAMNPPTPLPALDLQRREEEEAEILSIIFGKDCNESKRQSTASRTSRDVGKTCQTSDNCSWKGFERRKNNSVHTISLKVNDENGDMQLTIEDLDYQNESRPSLQLSVEQFGQKKRRVTYCRSFSTNSFSIQEKSDPEKVKGDVSSPKQNIEKLDVVSL